MLLALTHLQAIYTCAHSALGADRSHGTGAQGPSMQGDPSQPGGSTISPTAPSGFLWSRTLIENFSFSSPLPRGSLHPLEWKNSVLHEHAFSQMYW